ncbi:hypothetical protein EB796_013339 [Bugula neritina]|uniref:Uncharacterized protein n=1 Tax=Bugula neritina TaxID=10212 RepID=A0A7J7JPS2_BUGNE|nr:hypothetical protein EB796_013339 [Bugula neritina]
MRLEEHRHNRDSGGMTDVASCLVYVLNAAVDHHITQCTTLHHIYGGKDRYHSNVYDMCRLTFLIEITL